MFLSKLNVSEQSGYGVVFVYRVETTSSTLYSCSFITSTQRNMECFGNCAIIYFWFNLYQCTWNYLKNILYMLFGFETWYSLLWSKRPLNSESCYIVSILIIIMKFNVYRAFNRYRLFRVAEESSKLLKYCWGIFGVASEFLKILELLQSCFRVAK